MKLIKKQSKQTYTSNKDGKEHHYYNYFIDEDGKRIQVKCVYKDDVKILDFLSIYER